MPQSPTRRPKKLLKCIYFYKQSPNSPKIHFAALASDGSYGEFHLVKYSEGFSPSVIAKMRSLFMKFELDIDTDVTFSEEFSRYDPIRFYFELIRDHLKFRISTLKLKKVVRGIARRHPHSVMTKREIEYHKRGTKDPGKVGAERLNKVWKYLVDKRNQGLTCPWITKDVDYQLQNKSNSVARRYIQMRLAMYYLALKNDMYGFEAMRDKRRLKIREDRERQCPKVDLEAL